MTTLSVRGSSIPAQYVCARFLRVGFWAWTAFAATTLNIASAEHAPESPFKANATVRAGDVYFQATDGSRKTMTHDRDSSDPVVSPDGYTLAFVHADTPGSDGELGHTSLWLLDTHTGARRRLVASHAVKAIERDPTSFYSPVFSLDGSAVYISAVA